MIKKLLPFILMFATVAVYACPGCDAAAGAKNQTPWKIYILGGFIILTYIPFYILFRSAKKYDPKYHDGNE